MVDLHLGARPIVAGIHVEHHVGPSLRGRGGLTISACVVPGIDTAGCGDEAARADT